MTVTPQTALAQAREHFGPVQKEDDYFVCHHTAGGFPAEIRRNSKSAVVHAVYRLQLQIVVERVGDTGCLFDLLDKPGGLRIPKRMERIAWQLMAARNKRQFSPRARQAREAARKRKTEAAMERILRVAAEPARRYGPLAPCTAAALAAAAARIASRRPRLSPAAVNRLARWVAGAM